MSELPPISLNTIPAPHTREDIVIELPNRQVAEKVLARCYELGWSWKEADNDFYPPARESWCVYLRTQDLTWGHLRWSDGKVPIYRFVDTPLFSLPTTDPVIDAILDDDPIIIDEDD